MILPEFYFRYSRQKVRDRINGGVKEIFVPKVPCRFIGKTTINENAVLDSGADGCVINIHMARQLGLDLKESPPMNVVGFEDVKAYEASVKLVIGGARCTDPIPLTVRIPARGDTPTLIGRDPIFMLYEITFIEAERKINMIPYQQK